MEGRGMGLGTRGKQDGHSRDFQILTRQALSGRKAGNLKEVSLGWIRGGRKDRGLRFALEHLFETIGSI